MSDRRLRIRIEVAEPGHVHFAVWMSGALVGRLCMTPAEFGTFDIVLLKGYGDRYTLERGELLEGVIAPSEARPPS